MAKCWFRGLCTRRCSYHPTSHFCKGRGRLSSVATHISSMAHGNQGQSWECLGPKIVTALQVSKQTIKGNVQIEAFPAILWGAEKLLEKFAWTPMLVAVFVRWPLFWDHCEESRLKAQSSWKLSGFGHDFCLWYPLLDPMGPRLQFVAMGHWLSSLWEYLKSNI